MEEVVKVSHLKRNYQIHQKQPGLLGSFKSLFRRKYHQVKAVNDISFSLMQGELIGFIGPNGAGKTTTLKCLSGLLHPDSGKIRVSNFIPFERKKEFLKNIALVMGQKNQLWWDLPPIDSFILNKEIYEIDEEKYQKTLNELVSLLEVKRLLKTQVKNLSLGERMKMELIAALIHSPKVLFLDEPTIGLDVIMQESIREFIKEYNRKYKATIILTSHYMEDVVALCKRVILIDKGKIIYDQDLDTLVKAYADEKILSVVFKEYVDPKKIPSIGKVKVYDFPKVVIVVPRSAASFVASEILQKFPVIDLNIEEPEVEDVIRKIFKRNAKKVKK